MGGNGSAPPRPSDANCIALSIVIPVFNESQRIQTGLRELLASVERGELAGETTEFIVVDDGSTDDTAEQAVGLLALFARSTLVRLPKNRGKGAAIRAGVARAQGAITAFMDVDMSVHPLQMASLLTALNDADIAIGSRALPESETECDSVLRIVMGRSFARVVKILVDLHLYDTQCGFKAYRAPVARVLFHCSTVDGFSFDVEILAKARQLGLRITEVPVHWRHQRISRVRPFKDPIMMVADLVKIRSGRRKVANIPGVVIRALPGLTPPVHTARSVLGPTMPIVPWQGDDALVLLPLCQTDDVERQVAQLEEIIPSMAIRQISLTAAQLVKLDPPLLLIDPGPPATPPDERTRLGPTTPTVESA